MGHDGPVVVCQHYWLEECSGGRLTEVCSRCEDRRVIRRCEYVVLRIPLIVGILWKCDRCGLSGSERSHLDAGTISLYAQCGTKQIWHLSAPRGAPALNRST